MSHKVEAFLWAVLAGFVAVFLAFNVSFLKGILAPATPLL
jgi:hypothetical protein